MENLETIEGYLSVKDLGIALKRHVKLMVDSSKISSHNSVRLNGLRNLCDLYERYNDELKKIEEEKGI